MSKTKILIVEDCPLTSRKIKVSLEKFDYNVVGIAISGEEAIFLSLFHKPDLILMDIEIEGDIDGIEAARKIRLSLDIPIIYLTALSDKDTLSKAKATGGFAYLAKPFRTRDLHANIEMITYAHNMKKQAKENEIKYKNIFNNMFDGFAYYKIVCDENNRPHDYVFLEVNNAFERLIGIPRDKIINKGVNCLATLYKSNKFFEDIKLFGEAAIDGKKLYIKEYYFEYADKWFSIGISSPQPGYLSTLMTDITEIKKTAERLRYLTFYDSLTGLYNRAYFEEELKRLDTPRQLPLSLILGDINGLKLANDVFGHKEGDKLLISISNKLRANCRGEDLVARWGGDEFIILLPKTGEKEVAEICNRIKKACLECDESIIKTSIALGAVTKRTLDQDLNKLLLEAENKMYKNKLVESKRVHERIIDSLQGYLLNKTHETREHIENTKKIALLMANCLGLSSNKKHELELLAEFHDIGKISVSVEITDERKALTEAEKELIKQHPVIGYRIATASAKLMPIAEEILFHHEWWNGKGYPLGLKGDDIPLIARIFSIANSYDVMIRGYGYRPPMSKHQAIDKINNYAGTQFDPRMVKVFMQIIENNLL